MIICFCVSKNHGLMFNNRRVSSDINIIDDIIKMAQNEEKQVFMNLKSQKLFENYPGVHCSTDYISSAKEADGIIFAEEDIMNDISGNVEKVIIYNFNRNYPADVTLDISAFNSPVEMVEFVGNSHELITKYVYLFGGKK